MAVEATVYKLDDYRKPMEGDRRIHRNKLRAKGLKKAIRVILGLTKLTWISLSILFIVWVILSILATDIRNSSSKLAPRDNSSYVNSWNFFDISVKYFDKMDKTNDTKDWVK